MGHIIPSNPKNLPYKLVAGVPEYVIGVDDLLEITLHRIGGDVVERVYVRPDGKISFSILFDVQADGLTPSELTKSLTQNLSQYIRSPRVELKVSEYRSKRILLLGAVSSAVTGISGVRSGPGIYPLKGLTTALSQLLDVGGAAPGARLEEVRLTRAGRTYILNLQQALTAGDKSQDVVLEREDILFIAGAGQGERRVIVLGEVSKQGIYSLEKATLLEALMASGGFTANSVEGRVHVIRMGNNPHTPTVFSVNARKLYSGDFSQNMRLEEGDVISVSKEVLADVNRVLGQVGPILQALFLPATVVQAYTTASGILPIIQGPGGISFQRAQTLSLPAEVLGGATGGAAGGVTPGGGEGVVSPVVAPKPTAPEKKE